MPINVAINVPFENLIPAAGLIVQNTLKKRSQRLLLVSAIALLICIAAMAIGGRQLMRQFNYIEQQTALAAAGHVQRAFAAELEDLSTTARSFAESDAAYDFVNLHDNGYVQNTFRYETLDNQQVDVVMIAGRDGHALFAAQVDAANHRVVRDASRQLINALMPLRTRFTELQVHRVKRLIRLRDGLLAFDAAEISRSDRSKPTGAVLFVGRYIEGDELERLRDTSQTDFELLLGETPSDVGILDRNMARWFAAADPAKPVYVQQVDDDTMNVALMLRDTNGQALGVLQWQMPRTIAALGWHTTVTLLGTMMSLLLVASGVVTVLFMRLQSTLLDRHQVQQRYTNIIHNLDESIVIADRETLKIREANPAVLRRLGYSESELFECTLPAVFMQLPMDEVRACNHGVVYEAQMLARDGNVIDVEVTLSRVSDQDGDLVCLLSRDVSTRKRAERDAADHRRKLSRLANHDSLTGLPNRLFLDTRLPRLLRRLADSHRLLAVFYVDIDHFKDINDSRGHSFGDRLLKIFSQRLKAAVGSHDLVVRMGGDEFVVVASLLGNLQAAEQVAQRLVLAAQAPAIIDDSTLTVSASVGVAVYPLHAVNTEALLKHADIALYQAKQAGRNGYKVFNADMNLELSEKLALEQALRHALGNNELFVEYQPIVDLHNGSLRSFEALARWQHPQMGLVPPARFIPIAEKSGLIVALGEAVLRAVMQQLQRWQQLRLPMVPVAVNISPLQLQRINLVSLLSRLISEFGVDSQWLTFEITESAVIHDYREVVATLEKIRNLGSKVLIDDFGTGFATLGHLKNLPIDGIKIDRSFVTEVVNKSSDRVIINGIVNMARELRLYTVAEGIETSEQLAKLRELECDQGQGYYFTSALPAADAQKMLEQMDGMKDLSVTVKHRLLRRVG
ncbi:MAG: EAL domain-containing protein [Steroidobacter sp.]